MTGNREPRTNSDPDPARDASVRTEPLVHAGRVYVDLVAAWFDAEREALLARADQLIARAEGAEDGDALMNEAVQVKHALQVIVHDRRCITSRLSGALGDSARAALASIDRSEAAWRVLAAWMGGSDTALLVADTLVQLRTRVEQDFPARPKRVQPGADDMSL